MKKIFALLALIAGLLIAIVSCKKDPGDCFTDCDGNERCEGYWQPERNMEWKEFKEIHTSGCEEIEVPVYDCAICIGEIVCENTYNPDDFGGISWEDYKSYFCETIDENDKEEPNEEVQFSPINPETNCMICEGIEYCKDEYLEAGNSEGEWDFKVGECEYKASLQ